MSNSADNWEYKFDCSKEIPVIKFPSPLQLTHQSEPAAEARGRPEGRLLLQRGALRSRPTSSSSCPACGAYVEFYGRLQVQCFTLAVASVYAVGQVTLGIAADSKAGITLRMKFGFGAEIVVGLPVVANVSVLYMVEVEVTIADNGASRRGPPAVPRLRRDLRRADRHLHPDRGRRRRRSRRRRDDAHRAGDVLDRRLRALGDRHQRHGALGRATPDCLTANAGSAIMPLSIEKLRVLTFPQRIAGRALDLHVLLLPTQRLLNALDPFPSQLNPGTTVELPKFIDADLASRRGRHQRAGKLSVLEPGAPGR